MIISEKKVSPTAATENAAEEVFDFGHLRCTCQTLGFHEGDL